MVMVMVLMVPTLSPLHNLRDSIPTMRSSTTASEGIGSGGSSANGIGGAAQFTHSTSSHQFKKNTQTLSSSSPESSPAMASSPVASFSSIKSSNSMKRFFDSKDGNKDKDKDKVEMIGGSHNDSADSSL